MSLLEQSPGGDDVSVLRAGPVLVGERLEQRCGALAAGAPLAAEDRSLGQRLPPLRPARAGRPGGGQLEGDTRSCAGDDGLSWCSRAGTRLGAGPRRWLLQAWLSAEYSVPPSCDRVPRGGLGLGPATDRLWTAPPRSRPAVAASARAAPAGDLGVGVWLLWHARRHHGWDRPGVPVTGVLLLMCALFLGWLAVQHPIAPAVPPSRPSAPVLI